MKQEQVLRVIKSLVELHSQGCSIISVNTELQPSSEDPDFLDPIVVIKYIRAYEYDEDRHEHSVKVYIDGSMSDF